MQSIRLLVLRPKVPPQLPAGAEPTISVAINMDWIAFLQGISSGTVVHLRSGVNFPVDDSLENILAAKVTPDTEGKFVERWVPAPTPSNYFTN